MSIARSAGAYVGAAWRWQHEIAVGHKLPGPLSISLTSYPPRFPTLALTLKSLLAQSVRPDHLYLWLAESDLSSLPVDVLDLRKAGLEIRACEDLRSYKKIVPALTSRSDEFLVIADDDLYYPRNWLRQLVEAYSPGRKEVLCGRAHRIRLNAHGLPYPYLQWQMDVVAGEAERLLFPTGVGGVLYEPGVFHADVTHSEKFLSLCPTADDVWLYWMASLNGARFRKVGPRKRQITWLDSQGVALYTLNRTANDDQIANMIAHYGFPALCANPITTSP